MQTLARWLRRLAEWLDPGDTLVAQARPIVARVEHTGRRGAYKAALALTDLRKLCPHESESRLKWAIESAVQGR